MSRDVGEQRVLRRSATKVTSAALGALMMVVFVLAGPATVAGADAPAAPSGLAPNGTTTGPNPRLSWNPVSGAAYYKVTYPNTSGSPQTSTVYASSYAPTVDFPLGTVNWSVTAYDASNTPSNSSNASFTNQSADGPSLTCPSSPLNYPAQTPTFTWNAVPGIKTYSLSVSTSSTFAPGSTNTYQTQATSYTLTNAQSVNGQIYYAQVVGTSNNGLNTPPSASCQYSVVWSAGTTGLNDAQPTLLSPADHASVHDVVLKWAPMPGAARYEVEISPNGDWTNNLLYDIVTDATTWSPGKTLNNAAYFWRVRGIDNKNNDSRWSDYPSTSAGDAWTFTVVPYAAPTLLSPTGGAMVTNPDLNFSWVPVPGAGAYELQWDNDPNFSDFTNQGFAQTHSCITTHTDWSPYTYESPPGTFNGPGGGNNSTCSANNLNQAGRTDFTQIFWRVRALDDYTQGEVTDPWNTSAFTNTNQPPTNGAFNGLWSTTGNFNFNNSPQTPTMTAPANGASVNTPTMSWTQVPGAKYYQVSVTSSPQNWDGGSSSCKPATGSSTKTYKTAGTSVTPSLVSYPRTSNASSNPHIQCPIGVSWTVQSIDNGGRTSPVPFARSFTWNGFSPGGTTSATITMTSAPANNATVTSIPSFAWQPVGSVAQSTSLGACGAPNTSTPVDHYQFLWFDSPSSSIYTARQDWNSGSNQNDPITEAFTPYDALSIGAHAWQVLALSADNCILAASAKTALNVQLTPVTLSSMTTRKQDGSANACTTGATTTCQFTSTPLVKWQTNPDADFYRVFIANDPNFTNPVRIYDTGHNSIRSIEALPDNQAGQSYYLFVQPCKADWYTNTNATGTICGANNASVWLNGPTATREWSFQKSSAPVVGLKVIDPSSPTSGNPQNACDGAPGKTSVSDIPTFCWNTNSSTPYSTGENGTGDVGAMRYHIQVSTKNDFSTILDQAYVDQASYTPYASSTSGSANPGTGGYGPQSTASSVRDVTYPDGTLYWRVQAIDATNNGLTYGQFSNGQPFTKSASVVALTGPANGASVGATPALSWQSTAFAAQYAVEVYKNGDTSFSPANKVFGQNTDLTAITPSANNNLTNGTALPAGAYAWRVRAVDAAGKSGGWSTGRTFTVAPSAPSLTSPSNGTLFTSTGGMVFTWTTVVGAVQYRIWAGKNNPPTTSTWKNQTTVSNAWVIDTNPPTGTSYWMVQALDGQGQTISTSAVWSFTYDNSRPTISGQTVAAQDRGALLSWTGNKATAVGAITSYTLTVTDTQPNPDTITTVNVNPNAAVSIPGTGGGGGNTVCDAVGHCSYSLTGLVNTHPYKITITPNDANGSGTSSGQLSVTPNAAAPFSSPTNCIRRLYSDLQGVTNPTSSQMNVFLNAMNNQGWSCVDVAAFMWQTAPFQDLFPIARLYQAYFLRIPDFGGLDYWIGLHRSRGLQTRSMSEFFVQSQEFKDTYGTLNNAGYVSLIYQNVLQRPQDPTGYNYWLNLLNIGRINRGQLMLLFSESQEYRDKYMPTMKAELLVLEFLRRTPTQAEVNYYVSKMTPVGTNVPTYDANVRAQIAAIMATPEYKTRAN